MDDVISNPLHISIHKLLQFKLELVIVLLHEAICQLVSITVCKDLTFSSYDNVRVKGCKGVSKKLISCTHSK